MRFSSFAALLALFVLAPPAGAATPGDSVTVAGARYVVEPASSDRKVLTRVGFDKSTVTKETSTEAERLSASAALVGELAGVLGLHGPRDGFVLDSVSLVHHMANRVFYEQVHDSVVISGGFAEIAVANGGLVYEINCRVEPFPEHLETRPLSRGEALSLAIEASGRTWDGSVFINKPIYGLINGPDPQVYHQIVFGTLRKSGRREDWEVFLTPDRRILYSHTGDRD